MSNFVYESELIKELLSEEETENKTKYEKKKSSLKKFGFETSINTHNTVSVKFGATEKRFMVMEFLMISNDAVIRNFCPIKAEIYETTETVGQVTSELERLVTKIAERIYLDKQIELKPGMDKYAFITECVSDVMDSVWSYDFSQNATEFFRTKLGTSMFSKLA